VRLRPPARGWLVLVLGGALAGCRPPESERRPGEAGADVGNRGAEITLHEQREPFHDTPDRHVGR
jgi:hypothetical protein